MDLPLRDLELDAEIQRGLNGLDGCGGHSWFQEFSGFPRLQPGDFFCSVLRQPFQALLDERTDEATAARACLLRGVIQLADQTGGRTNR